MSRQPDSVLANLRKGEKADLRRMRKKRFRLVCDDLFHNQYGNHKAWCFAEVDE